MAITTTGEGAAVQQVADYQLVRSLGEGNHGEFYLAAPPPRLGLTAEYVAVKVFSGATSEDAFRRTSRELQVFASVRSPYLVTLYDAGQDGSTFFYSMEYFPLGSLAQPARPLTRDEVLRALAHASRAAHALHEAGIVHRSIKPANILLHDDGAQLSDLGLVQLLAPGQTATGVGPVGGVEYIDPALLRGERGSRATDIWSLGVTLHRALTGQGVYGEMPEHNPLMAVRTVLTGEPRVSADLDPPVAEVIRACLAPVPSDRPATADALADRIESL